MDLSNDGIRWDGTFFGLQAIVVGQNEQRALNAEQNIDTLLIDALADSNRWVAAHVILTLRHSGDYPWPAKKMTTHWNGIQVSLTTRGAKINAAQRFAIREMWRKRLVPLPVSGGAPFNSSMAFDVYTVNVVDEFPGKFVGRTPSPNPLQVPPPPLYWWVEPIAPVDMKKVREEIEVRGIPGVVVEGDRDLESLAGLKGLRMLKAKYVPEVGIVAYVPSAAKRTPLKEERVTDAGLVHLESLKGLERVDLCGTKVTDAGLAQLKGLTSLRVLDLSVTKVTDAGLAHLEALQGLRSLGLRWTEVTDAGLTHLGGMTGLHTLDLSGTEVTDAGLAHLKGLTSLRVLDLSGTKVTDAGLAHLEALQGLRSLGLRWTEVTDAGLAHLRGMTGLHTLDLSRTKVTDASLAYLKVLTGLQTLDLTNTQVTGAGVAEFQRALPKAKIIPPDSD